MAQSLFAASEAPAAFACCAHGISPGLSFFWFFGEWSACAGHILPFLQHAISSHAGALHAASTEIIKTTTWSEANARRIVRRYYHSSPVPATAAALTFIYLGT